MTVRAKFKVQSITQLPKWNGPGIQYCVKLSAVSGGSEENKSFWEASPGGEISLNYVNEAVGQQLAVGAEFYVDFTPAA